ncbi:RNA-directed DNA polymerase, eukaryota, reverse transcriptase zinc-binding domain protein [Tanacetum coccineum]
MLVWVKIASVPLEAWSVKGISALASSLGKPIVMDSMTASMCYKGIGNLSYARVLVEMEASKDIKNEIEIQYIDSSKKVKGSKKISVIYDWKPLVCSHCKVFSHDIKKCKNGGVGINDADESQNSEKSHSNNKGQSNNQNQGNGQRKLDKGKQHVTKNQWKYKENNMVRNNRWKVKGDKNFEWRNDVDKFLNEKIQPTLKESVTWTRDMINYFKNRWEDNVPKKDNSRNGGNDIEYVLEENNGIAKVMADSVIDGIKVCSVLETRLKSKKLQKTYDRIIQGWDWVSSMQQCSKGCKIMVGWDPGTSVQVLHKSSQVVFCVISVVNYNVKCFYTFVYAANEGSDMRNLWVELEREKKFVNGKPWCIVGDMNVTLYPNEHSCGSSVMTSHMVEFQDCLNTIEVEDVCRSGLHFTWTKNLHKTKAGSMTGIFKKLDRVMTNEEFIMQYPNAHAKFLPYIISDHTPYIFYIPTSTNKKVKAFRFSNHLTKKQEFMHIVTDKWKQEIHDPHNHNLRETEALLIKEFHEAERDEEKFLFQQAKIKWLCKGDKNSSFFHKVLKGRRNIKFLGKAQHVQDIKEVSTLFQRRINENVAFKITSEVTDKEIKEAMFDIGDSKAPGPDGFSTAFFKKAWSIIGPDICNAIREIFTAGKLLGLCIEDRQAILSVLPFAVVTLPVRYLGVPLISKRLSVKECGYLLDKIRSKVKNWKNKSLFYAGRLQLIAVVLESIHVYWASVFLLPVTIINEINKMLKGFLWNQGDSAKGKAKYHGKTFADLRLKSYMGHIFKILSHRDLYKARLKDDLIVGDMISNGQWLWPEDWYEKFPLITQIVCPTLNEENSDKIVWKNRDGKDMKFFVSIVYSDMSIHYPYVPWWKLIWDIWNRVCEIANINHKGYDFSNISQYLIDAGNGNNIRSVIRRIAFSANIYSIWKERNERIFRDVKRNSEDVFKSIVEEIRHKLLGLTVKDSKAIRDVEEKWKVSCIKPP